jgi:iron complex transport system substrate-binding protein
MAALVAAAAFVLAAAACGSSSSPGTGSSSSPGTGSSSSPGTGSTVAATGIFPASVTTAIGVLHVRSRPARIVSLSPTGTEMLYAIGAGGQVKAVDSNSDYPPHAPVTRLSGFQPNVEAIVSYKPDLVVISPIGNPSGLVHGLAAFSIPVLDLPAPGSLSGVYSELDQLGQATGHLGQAESEVTALRSQIATIVASAPRHPRPLTYYYELDPAYDSATSSTFIGSVLALLGLKSIADTATGAASSGGYPRLSSEFIVKADPDYIILADTVCCRQDAAAVAHRPGWASLTGTKAGHVIALNDDIATRWGPRIAGLLDTVTASITRARG